MLGLYATPAGAGGGKVAYSTTSMGMKAAAVGAMSSNIKNGHSQTVSLGAAPKEKS